MLDKLTPLKALVAVALVTSVAGYGLVAQTNALDDHTTPAASDPAPAAARSAGSAALVPTSLAATGPDDFDGFVFEELSKTYETPVASGSLDLRIDHGDVRVIGWDKNAVLVQVLQDSEGEAQTSDWETLVDIQDQLNGEHLTLTVTVDQEGTYGVGVHGNVQGNEVTTGDPSPNTAIVAFVPAAAAYDEVRICSGQGHPMDGTFDDVQWPFSEEDKVKVQQECIADDESPGVRADIGTINVGGDSNRTRLNVTTGAQGIHGKALTIYSEYGSLGLSAVDFDAATLLSQYGHIHADALRAAEATARTEYGDIVLGGAAGAVQAWTNHGHISLALTPTTSGAYDLLSQYGHVTLRVPNSTTTGYDVETGTDYGDLLVHLTDTSVEKQDTESDDTNWTDPTAWLAKAQEWLNPNDDGYRYIATGTTDGFADLPVQVTVRAFTDYGNVVIADKDVVIQGEDGEYEHAEHPDEDAARR